MRALIKVLLLTAVCLMMTGMVCYAEDKASRKYPSGWCTYYVADCNDVYVPYLTGNNWGNAGNWKAKAEEQGFKTKDKNWKPKKYSVMVTNESSAGHVAIVKKVSGNTITVKDMNYCNTTCLYTVKEHTYTVGNNKIKGYILTKKAIEQYKDGDKDDKKTYDKYKGQYKKNNIWYDGKKQCY